MTNEQAMELGKRLVACPGFRWMPGMLVLGASHRSRIVDAGEAHALVWVKDPHTQGCPWDPEPLEDEYPDAVPNLNDPATLGCLLELVREAWGEWAHLVPFKTNTLDEATGELVPALWWALASLDEPEGICVDLGGEYQFLAGPTQAEALVAALEAAGLAT